MLHLDRFQSLRVTFKAMLFTYKHFFENFKVRDLFEIKFFKKLSHDLHNVLLKAINFIQNTLLDDKTRLSPFLLQCINNNIIDADKNDIASVFNSCEKIFEEYFTYVNEENMLPMEKAAMQMMLVNMANIFVVAQNKLERSNQKVFHPELSEALQRGLDTFVVTPTARLYQPTQFKSKQDAPKDKFEKLFGAPSEQFVVKM
jgi:hypothetical protein